MQEQHEFGIITRLFAVKGSRYMWQMKGGHKFFDIRPVKRWIPLPLPVSRNVCPGEIQSPCKKCSYPVTAVCEETLGSHEKSLLKRDIRPQMCAWMTS